MDEILQLAELIQQRNMNERQISEIIQRPATQGHIGEYIASRILGIDLAKTANNNAIDGWFSNEQLSGKSVNIKFYSKQEGLIAIKTELQPDYFLILTGPLSPPGSSKGKIHACVIDHIYLFDGKKLAEALIARGTKFSVATSVPKKLWEEAEIYPVQRNMELIISKTQRNTLSTFGSKINFGG